MNKDFKTQNPVTSSVLASITFFSDFSKEELRIVSQHIKACEFEKNEYVVKEGDIQEAVYFMEEGSVQVLKTTGGNNHQLLACLQSPQVFGELALVSYGKRSASILTSGTVKALKLSSKDFERLIDSNPKIAVKIMRKIANIISVRLKQVNTAYVNSLSMQV